MRYFGEVGLRIPPIYDNRFLKGIHYLVMQQSPYNYGRRLKTLRGLTPYEYICKICSAEPERFTLNPHHQMPGPNTW